MTEQPARILFVEDDEIDQMAIRRYLGQVDFPHEYTIAGSVAEASRLLASETFQVVVLDYLLGDGTAFDLFEPAAHAAIIMITGSGAVDIAVQALKQGAYDYVEKDASGEYLKALPLTIDQSIVRKQEEKELATYRQHLEDLVEERTAELRQAVDRYRLSEKKTESSLLIQRTVNLILQDALEPITIEQHMERALEFILTFSGLGFMKQGAIFLVKEEEPEVLVMAASLGLSSQQLITCDRIAFGTCVCGKAALAKEILTTTSEHPHHEIKLQGVPAHGHYCVPIVSGGKTLGVMAFYLPMDHPVSADEKESLTTVANTLASIIELKNVEKEKETLKNQLAQAQRIESIGRLAGGVAHDFNNLLTVINGYAQLALLKMDPADSLRNDIEAILSSGEKATDLTRQLLAFSRKQIMQVEVIDLNKELDNCQKMLDRLIGEDILVDFAKEAEEPWYVRADPSQLNQVLVNLAVNARDAMPDGGRLTFRTKNVVIDQRLAKQHYGLHEKDEYVSLEITDTGTGMSKEVKEQIFEPFFTTKEAGKGTGLGLSTVYGIIKQSKGYMDVRTAPGQGTTFSILLPRTRHEETQPVAQQVDELPVGSETILLVEDEQAVRSFAGNFLTSLGYNVLTAEDGWQALEVCNGMEQKVDLVITDVVMPRMGGGQLAERLQDICPKVKILFISGYTEDSVALKKIIAKDVNFLQKPFSPSVLGRMVRTILG